MKTDNTKDTGTPAKPKAKIKSLRLTKETVEDISKRDAGAIKGGANYSRAVSGGY